MRISVITSCAVLFALSLAAFAQDTELRAPSKPIAGTTFAISTTGQDSATFYLLGPGRVMKKSIQLGREIEISGNDASVSGTYRAIACSSSCVSTIFQVQPAPPAKLSFLLHPSRVPVSNGNAINGTALVYDRFRNTVLKPTKVEFHVTLPDGPTRTRTGESVLGVTWFEMGSTPKQGRLHIVASIGETAEPRRFGIVRAMRCPMGRSYRSQKPTMPDVAPSILRLRRTRRRRNSN